ncbi:MAG: phage tail protein [Eubacteriales bacterium]
MTSYTTITGDMWDTVAYKTLGSERYTDKLMALNLKHRETVIFKAGVVLVIPEKTVNVESSLPPWKQVQQ